MHKLLTALALKIHAQHARAYSYYKYRQSNITTTSPLTWKERDFYLSLSPGLRGKELVVYDIGAAQGIVSGCLGKLINVSEVHAFEPIPNVFQILQSNMKPFPKVSCHNVALGEAEGTALMQISKRSNSSSLLPIAELHRSQFPGTEVCKEIQIPVVRLDEYVEQNNLETPTLIKIDVQGFEKAVLYGAIETVSKSKYCVLEMSLQSLYEGSPLFDEIYRLMCDLDFQLTGLSSPLTGKTGIQLQVDGFFENRRLSNNIC